MFNSGGNFYGSAVPYGAGINTMVNANGDSCDQYHNIFLNPQLVNPFNLDFNLLEASPCIDAGDPFLQMDPDATVRDMGALYFFQSPVFVEISSPTSVIMIPGGGGSFQYDIEINSNFASAYTFDFWTEVIMPDTTVYGPILARPGITLQPGGNLFRSMTQYVPSAAPWGFYTLVASVGFLPDSVMSSSGLPFMKLLGDGGYDNGFGWYSEGWDSDINADLACPNEFILRPAMPNPFNPGTIVRFSLPEADYITLAVFDVQGRQVANLVEGFTAAGVHEIDFDGSQLSSGVYIVHLKSSSAIASQKLLLIK